MYMEEFNNTMLTNVPGMASMIKHAGRAMVERKICGSIVYTETVVVALGGSAPRTYTTSKHALVGLVQLACSELGAHGIRVNCISPFGVTTPLACNLKGTVLKPAHIAEAALFLASDEVDGGFTENLDLGS
ncbi:PREDICTED: short-chain dehydrogenase reductase 3b-like [Nelumbo nucifera]|uniref:Short-chain dehydrogenase reductase 3b-like n=1 Tax=Nelumbo nucifera TaxID=4432 RepID=A0A1U7ZII0_NELNU|nr:PREDICTED: short-chain dehydrogenase reductase 3b-like [Nelumbo nucifera]